MHEDVTGTDADATTRDERLRVLEGMDLPEGWLGKHWACHQLSEAASGELLGGLPLPGQVCATLAFSPDGLLLLTLPQPGRDLYLWDITHITDDVPAEEKELRRRNRDNMGIFPGARFYDAVWSEDGRFIFALDELGPIYVISAAG